MDFYISPFKGRRTTCVKSTKLNGNEPKQYSCIWSQNHILLQYFLVWFSNKGKCILEPRREQQIYYYCHRQVGMKNVQFLKAFKAAMFVLLGFMKVISLSGMI